MKIQHNISVNTKTAQKTGRSSSSGLFGQLLDAGVQTSDDSSTPDRQQHDNPPSSTQAPMQQAWHTLEESVSLLDTAMHCIESGDCPPQSLIQDIEQLRELLRQQVASGSPAMELKQADTMLAVEAERIRSMQS